LIQQILTLAVASGIIATPAAVLNPITKPAHAEVGIIAPAPFQRIEPLKPTKLALQPELTRAKRTGGPNLYFAGQCVDGVKRWKPEVRGDWHNAIDWKANALEDGWTVSTTPIVNSVAWSGKGRYGHVALVIGVGPGTVTIREWNYNFVPFAERVRVAPVSSFEYIY